MKKYLSFFAAALLLAACQSDDIAEQKAQAYLDGSIQFGVESAEDVTRTPGGTIGVIGDNNGTNIGEFPLKDYGFGVFASYTGDNVYENVTVKPDFMYNQKVEADGDNWVYNPLKYWANTGYTTFFAYAPYVDHTKIDFEKPEKTHCIAGMSDPNDEGDPWLIYVLAPDPWDKNSGQRDLLYGVNKAKSYQPWYDQKKADFDAEPMKFTFKHALGIIGDKIKIKISKKIHKNLTDANAKIYIDHIDMKYTNLTRKAKLILNSKNSPNWKPIVSGEVTTEREVTITKEEIAELNDANGKKGGYSVLDGYVDLPNSENKTHYDLNAGLTEETNETAVELLTGKGLFFIPYQVAEDPQQLEVTLYYQILSPGYEPYNGVAKSTTILEEYPGAYQDVIININKDPKWDKIYAPKIGDYYYSDGTWGEENVHADGALPIGVVGYLGNDIETYDPMTDKKGLAAHGLVIAFEDAAHFDKYAVATKHNVWGPSDDTAIENCTDYLSAYSDLNGEYNTNILYNKWVQSNKLSDPNYWAAYECCTYQPTYISGTPLYGARGSWHIGTMGEWARIWDTLAKKYVNYSGTDIKNAVTGGSISDGFVFYEATDGTIETSVHERYEAESLAHLGYLFEGVVHRDKFLAGLRYWTSTEVGDKVTTFEIIYSYPIVNDGISFFMNDIKYERRQIRPLLTF